MHKFAPRLMTILDTYGEREPITDKRPGTMLLGTVVEYRDGNVGVIISRQTSGALYWVLYDFDGKRTMVDKIHLEDIDFAFKRDELSKSLAY